MPTTRWRLLVLVATITVAGCGTSRTSIPDDLGTTIPGQPLLPVAPPSSAASTSSTQPASTTTSPFQTAGLKHSLDGGGTVVVSYPNNSARPPKGVAPAPAGSSYATITAKMCASKTATIAGDIVDPARFSVEVPGQGLVAYNPSVPSIRAPALTKGTTVAPGTCVEGTISFLIGGERHIESILYDATEGLFRWVS